MKVTERKYLFNYTWKISIMLILAPFWTSPPPISRKKWQIGHFSKNCYILARIVLQAPLELQSGQKYQKTRFFMQIVGKIENFTFRHFWPPFEAKYQNFDFWKLENGRICYVRFRIKTGSKVVKIDQILKILKIEKKCIVFMYRSLS